MKIETQKKVFVMVGSILLALATELVVFGYYWTNLTGGQKVLLIGLAFVAFVQLWASHWYIAEEAEWSLAKIAFFTSFGLAFVMAFNAGMILITRTDENKVKTAREEAAKIEANKIDQESRAKIAQIQAEADAQMTIKDWRTAREIRIERETKAKIEAEAKRRKELQDAAAPKAIEATVAVSSEDFKDFIEFARWYCKILVFWLPSSAGIIGMGLMAYVMLQSRNPKAARQPAAGQAPVSRPMSVPDIPVRTPNPEISLPERIRAGRDGSGIKN